MGVILEIVGILSIIGGIILGIAGVGGLGPIGAIVGVVVIVEGVILFAIGSIYRTVKKIREELKEAAIWLKAKR